MTKLLNIFLLLILAGTVQERVGFKVQASGGGSTRTDAHETTLQVRFDFSQQDKLVDHVLGAGRDRMRSFDHHQDVTAFLKEHWNELDKILLGDQGPVEVPLDRPLELLTIRVPLNLHAEFEKRVGEGSVSFYNPVYQVVHGTPAAFKWLDKRNAEKTGE